MISQFLNHSFVPDSVSKAKIIPHLKNKLLDFTSSNNYKPLTISTLISKVIEKVLLNRMEPYIKVSDNQFGYQIGCGTDVCVYSVKEVLNMYNKRKTPTFAAFIDV